jgi:hypothetical protein
MSLRRRICETGPEDEQFLNNFSEQVAMLTGMVKEIIEEEPRMLLSPVMRRMLADKAREVESLHAPLRGRLVVDNPGQPLQRFGGPS